MRDGPRSPAVGSGIHVPTLGSLTHAIGVGDDRLEFVHATRSGGPDVRADEPLHLEATFTICAFATGISMVAGPSRCTHARLVSRGCSASPRGDPSGDRGADRRRLAAADSQRAYGSLPRPRTSPIAPRWQRCRRTLARAIARWCPRHLGRGGAVWWFAFGPGPRAGPRSSAASRAECLTAHEARWPR